MRLSGDLQDRVDVQALNQWIVSRDPYEFAGKIVVDATLPPHGFQVDEEKLYLGVAAHQHLNRFLAGRGGIVDSNYLQPASA